MLGFIPGDGCCRNIVNDELLPRPYRCEKIDEIANYNAWNCQKTLLDSIQPRYEIEPLQHPISQQERIDNKDIENPTAGLNKGRVGD